jgi:hypothetical protein
MPTPAATSCCQRCEAPDPDGSCCAFAVLGKPGVAEIELLQQLEMQGRRYLVERRGQQGAILAVEAGDIAFARSIASAASSNNDRICVACVASIVPDSGRQIAEKQPLIGKILSRHRNKLRTL